MGAAVEVFPDSRLIEVGRDRFVPVKTTNDLLVLRSDVYDIGLRLRARPGRGRGAVRRPRRRLLQGRRRVRQAVPRGRAVDAEGHLAHRRRRLHLRRPRAGRRRRRAHRRARPSGSPPTRCSRPTPASDRPRALLGRGAPRAGARRHPPPRRRSRQPLLDTLGLACAEDVVATMSLPSFDNSAMDGYAVRQADVAAATAEQPVCSPSRRDRRRPGRAARARARAGGQDHDRRADPRRARTRSSPTSGPTAASAKVRIDQAPEPGQHVRPAGDDVAEGDLLIDDGTVLGPRHLGLLASVGRRHRAGPAAAAGRDPLDRLGAPRPGQRARPRLDLRRQLLHARGRGAPRRRDRRTASASSPTSPGAFLETLHDQLAAPTSSSPPAASRRATTTS